MVTTGASPHAPIHDTVSKVNSKSSVVSFASLRSSFSRIRSDSFQSAARGMLSVTDLDNVLSFGFIENCV